MPRQTNITEYFARLNVNQSNSGQIQNVRENNDSTLPILQLNACILNPENRAHLELLSENQKYDILRISEVGRYRKINGFQHYVQSDKYREAAIFWRPQLNGQIISTKLDKKHQRNTDSVYTHQSGNTSNTYIYCTRGQQCAM